MWRQLYLKSKAFLVINLFNNGWNYTLLAVQLLLRIDPVETIASTGSIKERITRFNQYTRQWGMLEQYKKSFMQGLLQTDLSGRNLFCNQARELLCDPQKFNVLLSDLNSTGCFEGPFAEENKLAFLQGMFRQDNNKTSAFILFLSKNLIDKSPNSLGFILTFFTQLNSTECKRFFLDALKAQNHRIFRKAATQLDAYVLLRKAMKQAECSSWEWNRLLNTDPRSYRKKITGERTPLMQFFLNETETKPLIDPSKDYIEFMVHLYLFREDGSLLNQEQLNVMIQHIHVLYYQKKIAQNHFNSLITLIRTFTGPLLSEEAQIGSTKDYIIGLPGTFKQRLALFKKYLVYLGELDEVTSSFLQSLVSFQPFNNVFYDAAKERLVSSSQNGKITHPFKRLIRELININCFNGSFANKNKLLLLKGIFAPDERGYSAFWFILEDHDLLEGTLKFFSHLDCYSNERGRFFLDAIKADSHELFCKAAETFESYKLVSQAMAKSRCSVAEWNELLNTDPQGADEETGCEITPLMCFILDETVKKRMIDPAEHYSEFMSFLIMFRDDGAQLNKIQIDVLIDHLHLLYSHRMLHELYLQQLIQLISTFEFKTQKMIKKTGECIHRPPLKRRFFSLFHIYEADVENDEQIIDHKKHTEEHHGILRSVTK